jgi:hypothetical protein
MDSNGLGMTRLNGGDVGMDFKTVALNDYKRGDNPRGRPIKVVDEVQLSVVGDRLKKKKQETNIHTYK